jgi:prepilin-type processing-associated H-X9-DG protein
LFRGDYFARETFEDGVLNVPGASASAGFATAPGATTDSVDLDDGLIDGDGTAGRSWYAAGNSVTFTFDPAALGGLPTHAGLVWTDVGQVSTGTFGSGTVVFEAFDGTGASLGGVNVLMGDGSVRGETPEDRFFGAISLLTGISKITISMPGSTDWEVDHLQYGRVVVIPEPSSALLVALGLLGLGIGAARRRS